jgi:hypothetical protein
MRGQRSRRLLSMAAVVVFASVLVPVGPAHAYNPNPEGRYFSQWAHDCSKHTVFPTGGDEFFKWGGRGRMLHQGGFGSSGYLP